MKRILLATAALAASSAPAIASSVTIADRCMAHVTNGRVTTFRDVDVLASGRDRISYFRCIRTGLRDDAGPTAFAGLVPRIETAISGAGSGLGLNL